MEARREPIEWLGWSESESAYGEDEDDKGEGGNGLGHSPVFAF